MRSITVKRIPKPIPDGVGLLNVPKKSIKGESHDPEGRP
jgi:hypothetical protein